MIYTYHTTNYYTDHIQDYMLDIDTTALAYCIKHGDTHNAIELINRGHINYKYTCHNGYTLLLLACYYNVPDVALAIIATGESNPGFITMYSYTALIFACRIKMSEVALAILATGQSNPGHIGNCTTALLAACVSNLPEVALAIIATGESNPNYATASGNTAILWACWNMMSDVALALIATGELSGTLSSIIPVARHGNMHEVVHALEQLDAPKS